MTPTILSDDRDEPDDCDGIEMDNADDNHDDTDTMQLCDATNSASFSNDSDDSIANKGYK